MIISIYIIILTEPQILVPGLMTQTNLDTIKRNFVELTDNMNPDAVLDTLYQELVITREESEDIMSAKTRTKRNRELLQMLETKADDAFYTFRGALVTTGQVHLAALLGYKPEKIDKKTGIQEAMSESHKMAEKTSNYFENFNCMHLKMY